MLNRNVSLALCLSVLAGAAFAQSSNQGTGYVFEFANTVGASGQFQAFIYNTSSLGTPVFNTTGPAGANQVVPKPDGSKFYVVGSGGVDDFNPLFATPATLNGITGTPTQAVMSPDGRFLTIATSLGSGSGAVYVLNTLNDTIVLTQPISGAVIGMVVSRDSNTLWILDAESGQAVIVTLSLTSLEQVGSPVFLKDSVTGASLGGDPQALTLSPLGLMYVSAGDQILEFDPATLQKTFAPVEISVNATVGPLVFSTDGSMAYFVNTTPSTGGRSLGSITLPGHTVAYSAFVSGQPAELFDSIMVISSPPASFATWRLLAHSPGDSTLWDVAPDLSTVTLSALNSILPAASVLSVAVSNELPSAHYLYALVGSAAEASLDRVDLTTNAVTSQASSALGSGTLQFAIVPPETNPTSFIQYNALQPNLAAGTTALPLIARVLDPVGRPMYNVSVTFTDPSLTIKFTGVSSITNEDGYAQATASFPAGAAPGSYPVTLTAGSATATFSLTIPGASGTGPTGGGPNLMTIVAGNGQLFQAFNPHFNTLPLTIQEVDATGKPVVNDDITFTIAGPIIGSLSGGTSYTTTTADDGTATASFFPQGIAEFTPFQGTTITAVGTQGAVTFNETVYQTNPDGTGAPSVDVLVPAGTQTIIAGEGDVVPMAISAVIFSHSFSSATPIPNIAINITNSDGTGSAGPGTCQGNPMTDSTGKVSCNFIASCTAGQGLHGFYIDFGDYLDIPGYSVNIGPGSTQAFGATLGGNNQSGRPGTALGLPLTATVTDQCGTPSQGVNVTWKVTQGTATLAATSTVSNQGGTVADHLTLGNTPGTVTVVASINSSTVATFTATIQAVVGSLKLVSGGGQVVGLNSNFLPIVFQITDTSNNPVPGLVVSFAVASGSASINTLPQTTNAQGEVTVQVTAGNVAGTVTITATYNTFTTSATLTVTAPGPAVFASSFVNAASLQSGLTPCGLAYVTGSGLAPGVNGIVYGANPVGPAFPWPSTLAGVTITINGSPAPLQAVSNQNGIQQVNFQTPCEIVAGSPATVTVQVGTGATALTTQVSGVTVYPAQPGIFSYGTSSTGIPYGLVTDANGSALSPGNLAHAGQTYVLYTTGLGQTNPAALTNAVGTGETIPPGNIILDINNIGVPVNSVQYQQDSRGVYVITFTIPVPFASGVNLPISLGVTVNSQSFFDNQTIALPGID